MPAAAQLCGDRVDERSDQLVGEEHGPGRDHPGDLLRVVL